MRLPPKKIIILKMISVLDYWLLSLYEYHVLLIILFCQFPPLCSTTYITCPADPKRTQGIKLPSFMIIKILRSISLLKSRYQVLGTRFNLSDFTTGAYGTNYTETLGVQVSAQREESAAPRSFWYYDLNNHIITFLLLVFRLFRSQIHANCRIRRVYFSDRLYSEDELPAEFKLYLPVQNQKAKVSMFICMFNVAKIVNIGGKINLFTCICTNLEALCLCNIPNLFLGM